MKAEELVGKWIVSDVLTDEINAPTGAAFKVVGYTTDMKWVIVDAGSWGWDRLDPDDIVIEKCKNYWYVSLTEITKVL